MGKKGLFPATRVIFAVISFTAEQKFGVAASMIIRSHHLLRANAPPSGRLESVAVHRIDLNAPQPDTQLQPLLPKFQQAEKSMTVSPQTL